MLKALMPIGSVLDHLVHESASDAVSYFRHRAFLTAHLSGGLIGILAIPLYLAIVGAPSSSEAVAFAWLATPTALIMLAVAAAAEILAYYIPGVDNLLDTLATPAAFVAGTVVTAAVFRLTWLYAVAAAWACVALVSFVLMQRVEFILFAALVVLVLQGGTGLALLALERRLRH